MLLNYNPASHIKICLICGNEYYTTRNHSKTCTDRCRSLLYNLNHNYLDFSNSVNYPLFPLTMDEINIKMELAKTMKLIDTSGNAMEFVNGFKDLNGNLKITIFRIRASKYLQIWNTIGEDFIIKPLPYG